jgi:anti-sigma regulatory factor (Ser/Thr protein kinase)
LRELALHILDIAENSISARASTIEITVFIDSLNDQINISIEDDGKGIDAETLKVIVDPFVTSRTTRRVGLGIPMFKAAAEACNGSFLIESEVGKGTMVSANFQNSHIDRMPLGNMADTITTLLVGTPEVHWIFNYTKDGKTFVFDDQPIKDELDGIPLCEPEVLKFIRSYIQQGIDGIQ